MEIFPVHSDITEYLKKRQLLRKFEKQLRLFKADMRHPSLNVELMEPAYLKLWSFRVDKKYRAIFFWRDARTIEIIDVNNHYR